MQATSEPQTISADGKAPENRVETAAFAWSAYDNAKRLAGVDDDRFSSLRGIFDGFPPVPHQELADQGMADMPNINLRQFSSKIETYVSTWIAHDTGGDKWFEMRLKAEYFNSPQEAVEASDFCSQHFNAAIKQWDGLGDQNAAHYIFHSAVRNMQMGIFGLGIARFNDAKDWRWSGVPTRKVYVPRGTRLLLDNCQAMWIEESYSVSELYRLVSKNRKSGWVRSVVLKMLHERTCERLNNQTETFADWENRVRNNDAFLRDDYFNPVDLVRMYVQEFTDNREKDGISSYVFGRAGSGTTSQEFMYKKDREFERWNQVVVVFADSTGPEGEWHGVRGFGDKIYDACHLANLFFNQTAIAALVSSMPIFECATETDREKLNQIVFSRLGVLFPGLTLSQQRINADVTGCLAILAENNRVMDSNTRIFPQNQEAAGGEQPTATQVSYDRQDQATFTTLQLAFYRMTGADRLGFEMHRRISQPDSKYPTVWPGGKVAKAYRDACKKYGVSQEALEDPEYVRVSRSGGSGNAAIDLMRAEKALSVATPGEGQTNARKEVVAATHGRERVPDFIQDDSRPLPEDVVIGLENTVLSNGQLVNAFGFQDHLRHLGDPQPDGSGHLAVAIAAQQAAEQISQAGVAENMADAVKVHKTLESVVAHVAQHAQFMAQMPIYKETGKPIQAALNTFAQFTENLGNQIQKAQGQQQQQNGQMTPDMVKAMVETQFKMQMKQQLAEHEMQLDEARQALKMTNQAETQRSRHAIKEQDANLQRGLAAESTLADIEMERTKAAQQAKTRAKGNVAPKKK